MSTAAAAVGADCYRDNGNSDGGGDDDKAVGSIPLLEALVAGRSLRAAGESAANT